MNCDVFFYEAFDEEQRMLRDCLPTGIRGEFSWKTIQERGDREPPAAIVSTRTQSVIPVEWAGRLAGILTRSTGYDHILAYRRACGRNVSAGYLPLYCSRSVAEQALLLWMALLRQLPGQMAQFRTFCRDNLTGRECAGKTLLVVGVGNIGSEVVGIARGLGMRALGVDLVEKHRGVDYLPYEEGAPQADIAVCAMNLTAENRGYFDLERLRRLKRGALFVNVARGELARPEALLGLLREGHLAGIGLDVYDRESELAVALRDGRLSVDDPSHDLSGVAATLALVRHPAVIALPHNAFNTVEAVERKTRQSVEAIEVFVRTGNFPHPI